VITGSAPCEHDIVSLYDSASGIALDMGPCQEKVNGMVSHKTLKINMKPYFVAANTVPKGRFRK